jgi:hypothetical protein
MKKEKMELELVPSPQMDRWAAKNKKEHGRVRFSRKARSHYGPSDWKNTYIKVHGNVSEDRLRIEQAVLSDIKKYGASRAKRIGFVTTETYTRLMGKENNADKRSIWISENAEKVTIGADPEFVLTDKEGVAVYGDTAFPNKWSKLGSDGPCAELRPNPSGDVEGLVRNIESLLTGPEARNIDKYNWIGGATYRHPAMNRRYSIGGHIHFGLPNIEGAAKNTKPLLQKRVSRILDELVAIPLIRIDTPMPEERRGSLGYGRFEDVKTCNYKLEWRVPSGIWLVHPDISNFVLGTSKAVVEECWKKYTDRDCSYDFMIKTEDGDSLVRAFSCKDTEVIRGLVNKARHSEVSTELVHEIHGRLKKMSTYCVYKEAIDGFIKLCCSKNTPLPTSKLDLKRNWVAKKSL